MSAKPIAVLDQADLEDGQMYEFSCASSTHVGDCSTGRTSRLIQEQSFCRNWLTKSMQLVHFALTAARFSSKASLRLMAGSFGEIFDRPVLMGQLSDLMRAARGMEVYLTVN